MTFRFKFQAVAALAIAMTMLSPSPALAGGERDEPRPPERDEAKKDDLEDRVAEMERELEALETTVTNKPDRGTSSLPGVLSELDLYGHVVGGYGFNLGDPSGRTDANELRLSDSDHNTLGLTYAKLGVARGCSEQNEFDAGFRIEIGAGRLVQKALADDGLFGDEPINLPQAYAQVQLPTPWGLPVSVRAGKIAFMFGGESLDLPENMTSSLGYLAQFGPKTLTGAGVIVRLSDGLAYEAIVANGWDRTVDDNDGKTVGGRLTFERAGLSLRASWLLGAERPDDVSKHRWAISLDGAWKPTIGTEVRAAFMYGEEEGADVRNGGLARFGGIGLGLKQGLFLAEGGSFHHLALVARGEVFRDRGGSRSGEHQDLAQVTGGFEVRPVERLSLRAEYRHDWSSADVFAGKDEQESVFLTVGYSF